MESQKFGVSNIRPTPNGQGSVQYGSGRGRELFGFEDFVKLERYTNKNS